MTVAKTNMVAHRQTDREVPYRHGFLLEFCVSVVTWKFWRTWLYHISSRAKDRCTLQAVYYVILPPLQPNSLIKPVAGVKLKFEALKSNEEEGTLVISNLMHKIIYLHTIHLLKSSTCFEQ